MISSGTSTVFGSISPAGVVWEEKLSLGMAALENRDASAAAGHFAESAQLAKDAKLKKEGAISLISLALAQERLKKHAEALQSLRKAQSLATSGQPASDALEAELNLLLGRATSEIKNDAVAAEAFFKKSVHYANKAMLNDKAALALAMQGCTQVLQRLIEPAQQSFNAANVLSPSALESLSRALSLENGLLICMSLHGADMHLAAVRLFEFVKVSLPKDTPEYRAALVIMAKSYIFLEASCCFTWFLLFDQTRRSFGGLST